MSAIEETSGTLRKSALLLKCLAGGDSDGFSLAELSRRVGIPHPSVYRLLQVLKDEGMVRRDSRTKRYTLGPVTFELGLAAGRQFDVRRILGPTLRWVVSQAGDPVYLTVRSGSEEVCADRAEGSSVIVVRPLRVGSRRPLGLTAGGIAMLSSLDDDERERVIRDVIPELVGTWDTTEDELRQLITASRTDGYTLIRDRVVPGASAVAMPIHDGARHAFAALSIPCTNDLMTSARIRELVPILRAATQQAEQAIHAAGWEAGALPDIQMHA